LKKGLSVWTLFDRAVTCANAGAEMPLPPVPASDTNALLGSLGMPRQWTAAGGL